MYKPLFIWGAGIRGTEKRCLEIAEANNIPIALTWGAVDLLPHDHRLNVGTFGTHGVRAANLSVQNASNIISFGCRLDTKATGTPKDFAPKAIIDMVDIDKAEIDKMAKVGRKVYGHNMTCDAAYDELVYIPADNSWASQCRNWKAENIPQGPAYDLMRKIGEYTNENDIIVSDTGNTLGWIMQGFPFKGEWFIHAFNFTPMGYGLGGAIGAAFAGDGRRVVCIVGDGGALMSIQELATIARHNLNIKIILNNNSGHQMCRTTQDQWLGKNHYATSIEGGLGFPDWNKTADAFDIPVCNNLSDLFVGDGPKFYEAVMDKYDSLYFQVKFGEPLA